LALAFEGKYQLPMLTLVASIEGESSVMNIDARDEMNLTQCSRGYWNIQSGP
jgi:hypothetical protein